MFIQYKRTSHKHYSPSTVIVAMNVCIFDELSIVNLFLNFVNSCKVVVHFILFSFSLYIIKVYIKQILSADRTYYKIHTHNITSVKLWNNMFHILYIYTYWFTSSTVKQIRYMRSVYIDAENMKQRILQVNTYWDTLNPNWVGNFLLNKSISVPFPTPDGPANTIGRGLDDFFLLALYCSSRTYE